MDATEPTSLVEVARLARQSGRTVTVYGPRLPPALPTHFGSNHVELRHVPIDVDSPFVVLSADGEPLSVLHLADVEAFADRETSVDPTPEREERYREFLSKLAGTTFSSLSHGQLLATTREFEDRAFREGTGTLYSGFQTLSKYRGEIDTYRRLAERGLDVHVYGAPTETPPSVPNVTVHAERAPEIAETWFVAYDGGGTDEQKCALLAVEFGDEFEGVWSYDPEVVDALVDYLQRAYDTTDSRSETA